MVLILKATRERRVGLIRVGIYLVGGGAVTRNPRRMIISEEKEPPKESHERQQLQALSPAQHRRVGWLRYLS